MTKPDFHALMAAIDEIDREIAAVSDERDTIQHRLDALEARSQGLHSALVLMGGDEDLPPPMPAPKRKRRTKAEIAAAKAAANGHAAIPSPI